MRSRQVWFLALPAVTAFAVWMWVCCSRAFLAFAPSPVAMSAPAAPPQPPAPPPETVVHVIGHGAERVISGRLTWSIEMCAGSRALLTERTREALRRAHPLLDADDVVPSAIEGEDQQHPCVTLAVSTARVENALRWGRALSAARLIEADEITDPECTGDEGVAAAQARAALTAITDARTQVDALRRDPLSTSHRGLQAEVQHDEGSYDNRCQRVVTATADLTVPTS